MPVQIDAQKGLILGKFITLSAINKLVRNFIRYSSKEDVDTGTPRRLRYKDDSYSVWFSKKEIDQLIQDNTDPSAPEKTPTGIRIYIGYHAENLPGRENPPTKNQHTVVLVSTYERNSINHPGERCNQDILEEGKFVSFGDATGDGLDEGSIAPPPYPIEGSKVDPT